MKVNVKILLASVISILFLSISVRAQTGKESGTKYGKGEDSIRCLRNLSLYRDFEKREEDYKIAQKYWVIPFDECPASSQNLYIHGAKFYEYFLDINKDPQRKTELFDTLMLIYNRRIEYFGEEDIVRGRQGADILKYRRNDGIEYIKEGYNYLKKSMELRGERTSNAVLPTLLSASITLGKEGILESSQVIEDYIKVSEIIDAKIARRASPFLIKIKESMDYNFVNEGPGSCDTLIAYFSKEIETKKEDPAFLEMLTNLLSNRECTNAELYFTALKELHRLAPSAESAVKIAVWAKDKKRYKESIEYLNQALQMETDEDKKADYYLGIAVSYDKLDDKPKSREFALKAANARAGFGEPFILIGQLYADSKDICTDNGNDKNLPNAVFWAAVDMFNKAKTIDPALEERANKLILTYTPYYPKKEDAFVRGWYEDDTYQIDCWINVSTKVRF